jgi:hypothetical protein
MKTLFQTLGFSGTGLAAVMLSLTVSATTPKKAAASDPGTCVLIGGFVVCGAGIFGGLALWLYHSTSGCMDGSCPRTADGSACAPNATSAVSGHTCECVPAGHNPCLCNKK